MPHELPKSWPELNVGNRSEKTMQKLGTNFIVSCAMKDYNACIWAKSNLFIRLPLEVSE